MDVEMLHCFAVNEHMPVRVLEKLSTEDDFTVRTGVARNPSTPVWVLEKLSTDPAPTVRLDIVWNPNTPVWVLEKLSKDVNGYVSLSASTMLVRRLEGV